MGKAGNSDVFFKKIVRFIKYNSRLVFVIVFFIGLISLSVFGNKGLIQRIKLESEKKDYDVILKTEVKKSEELQKEIDELKSSDNKIEKVAREKYGMTKEGEKIHKIIIDSTK
ncbi:MAG: septum formation initiator family protein [Ignavibacteria bacterium]